MNNHSCKPKVNHFDNTSTPGPNSEHCPNSKPLFHLGPIVATPGALEALQKNEVDPATYLCRHMAGDWGELCDEDKAANDQALQDGSRLLSAYRLPDGEKLWIITEATDVHGRRLASTLLLPSEY